MNKDQLTVIADDMLPVYKSITGEKIVDARELHEKLLIGTRFNDWISRLIDTYSFLEGEDFYSHLSKTSGRPSQEYLLSVDTAKEIAMVQNNEMGRQIRKYFIAVEKRYKAKEPKTQMEYLAMLAQQMVEQERQSALLDKKINAIESGVQTITHNLTAVPDHSKVIERVNEYARWSRMGHDEIYNTIYSVMKAQHGIDVPARVENERRKINAAYYEKTGRLYAESTLKRKVNGIDVMVRMQVLDKFNNILVGFLAKAKGIPTS
ncbi:antA/AntB antirepressor family protein [Fredinandcohnia sp. 179-A 10B2 NHS]|uniref:antA/AntB antirepressor family protein n=1 Tax=Fredinandcohnia sp. 179-A 10B2 NHS TaxID=3235176 RepID=UPI0039A2FDB5